MGKLYWLLESSGLSGGVRVIFEFALGLKRFGWDSVFLSLNDRPDWFNTKSLEWVRFGDYNALIAHINEHPDERYIATWWRTAAILKQTKYTNGYYIVQDDESWYYTADTLKDMVRETYSGLKMFTTSHWVEQNVPSTHYVGIGIRQDWEPGRDKKRMVASVARRQYIKGFSYLIEAVNRLVREMAITVVTYGHDQYVDWGYYAIHRYAIKDKEVRRLLQESQYYISTSLHEGFNLPNLEAMASGCVVVTTDSGGINDYCVDNENCFIVSPSDPREMLHALKDLDANESLRKRLAAAGLETVKNWRWGPPTERLDQFLRTT